TQLVRAELMMLTASGVPAVKSSALIITSLSQRGILFRVREITCTFPLIVCPLWLAQMQTTNATALAFPTGHLCRTNVLHISPMFTCQQHRRRQSGRGLR